MHRPCPRGAGRHVVATSREDGELRGPHAAGQLLHLHLDPLASVGLLPQIVLLKNIRVQLNILMTGKLF